MRFLLLFLLLTQGVFAKPLEWEKRKAEFEEQGFIWIKNFFSNEQVLLLKTWAEELNADAEKVLALAQDPEKRKHIPASVITVAEAKNPNQVCRTEEMLHFYPDLYHLIQGTLTAFLSNMMDEPYVVFKDKLNFKWPGGGAFPPHQDFQAFSFFGPREHITAMICIDPANLENGCLQVAQNWKKSFRGDENLDPELLNAGLIVLPYVEGGKNHGSIKPEYVEKIDWLALNTEPGDLVLFNSFLPHYSEPNRSKGPRRAMFLTLNRLSEGNFYETYYHTKRNDPLNPAFHFATPTKARTK